MSSNTDQVLKSILTLFLPIFNPHGHCVLLFLHPHGPGPWCFKSSLPHLQTLVQATQKIEEEKPCTSHDVHTCNIPDIQKDAEFIMEHLNDLNFDLSQLPSSIFVVEEEMTKRYVDQDCHGAIDLDE